MKPIAEGRRLPLPTRGNPLHACLALVLLGACGSDPSAVGDLDTALCTGDPVALVRPDTWTPASHGAGEPADYDRLLDDTQIKRLDITVAPTDYAATQADLEALYGGSRPPGTGWWPARLPRCMLAPLAAGITPLSERPGRLPRSVAASG